MIEDSSSRSNIKGMASKYVGALGLVAVLIGWAHIIFVGGPKLPVSAANGSYSNACCGTLVLKNGRMRFSGGRIARYDIEQDKVGPYIITDALVEVINGRHVSMESGKEPFKLRLDRTPNPSRIELTDLAASNAYQFVRQVPNQR
ncbi:hypothetical protein PX699_29780 [Sphingobium sp. H39-3-25]|uniref:hypothetical protein n=1 Tax=Sphingobium arseniciresistens TaxID=3030834 RepID=UPI0023B9D820|nr:hypothetical protein [Sphingobium arseniciresistens]